MMHFTRSTYLTEINQSMDEIKSRCCIASIKPKYAEDIWLPTKDASIQEALSYVFTWRLQNAYTLIKEISVSPTANIEATQMSSISLICGKGFFNYHCNDVHQFRLESYIFIFSNSQK